MILFREKYKSKLIKINVIFKINLKKLNTKTKKEETKYEYFLKKL